MGSPDWVCGRKGRYLDPGPEVGGARARTPGSAAGGAGVWTPGSEGGEARVLGPRGWGRDLRVRAGIWSLVSRKMGLGSWVRGRMGCGLDFWVREGRRLRSWVRGGKGSGPGSEVGVPESGPLGPREEGLGAPTPLREKETGSQMKSFLSSPPSMGAPSTASWCSTRWTAHQSPTYNVTLPPAAPMSLSPGSMALSELFSWLREGLGEPGRDRRGMVAWI